VPREIQEKHALTILRLQKATGLDVAVGGEYENGRLSLTGTATRRSLRSWRKMMHG